MRGKIRRELYRLDEHILSKQGRSVTILTSTPTGLHGFKNLVQNSVFAFLKYIIGSLQACSQ